MGLIIVTAVHSKTAFCIRRAKMKVFERIYILYLAIQEYCSSRVKQLENSSYIQHGPLDCHESKVGQLSPMIVLKRP